MTELIGRDELAGAIQAGTVVVLDTLGGNNYRQQHLPGAIELVAADVDARAGAMLPDKSAAIVTYCANPACRNSQDVADRLEALGYTAVRKYREGIQDWVESGLPVESGAPVAG